MEKTPEAATESTSKKSASRIGKYTVVDLDKLELRDVWKHEALNFTKWMSQPEVLNRLGNVLGFNKELQDVETECKNRQSDRRCDIIAHLRPEDDDESQDEIVAIENQLEETDFSHLGRVILYAALHNATRIVWVVGEATYDHRKAIVWLNKNTADSLRFYLVEVVVYDLNKVTKENQIVPMFRLIEGPDEEEKVKKSGDPRQKRNYNFWSGFLQFLNEKAKDETGKSNLEKLSCITSFRQPTGDNWYGVSIGTGKCHIDLWDSHNRVDFSIQTYSQETFDTIKSIMPEMTKALGVNADGDYFGKKDARRPRIRFEGPCCDVDKDGNTDIKRKAYEWLVFCLSTLVPKIQKVLQVK